jgi:hypothetical protein
MKRSIETEIIIEASAERVWAVLLATQDWSRWNPTIPTLSGKVALGSLIRVRLWIGILPVMLLVRVTRLELHREFAWSGGVPGAAHASHGFRIEPLGPGRVRFVHYEHFEGGMAVAYLATQKAIQKGYEAMNVALKARCEA